MRSKLEIQKQRNDLINQIKESEKEHSILKTQLNEVEVNVNVVVSDMQKTETKNSKSK
jgi:structural maintenance of chromosome 3 (chondroitin sulfate proteoglycan 6)